MTTFEKSAAISKSELQALAALKPRLRDVRASSVITHFMAHGSLQSFVEDDTIAIKRFALEKAHSQAMSEGQVNAGVESTLQKLVRTRCSAPPIRWTIASQLRLLRRGHRQSRRLYPRPS